MTEQQYKDLLIATAKMSDYEHKDEVVEALKVASVSSPMGFYISFA